MKREYNEVYGYMPDEIINHLSQADRMRLFLDWINREPTDTGWLITAAVVTSLGNEFMKYILNSAIESVEADGDPATKEEAVEVVTAIFTSFATDVNILYEFVDNYLEEREHPVKIGSLFNTVQESVKEDLAEDAGKQPIDAKGRFTKKQE